MHSRTTDAKLAIKTNQLLNIDQLDQSEVDRALHTASGDLSKFQELPKGIDRLTLEKVQQILSSVQSPGLTSEEVASQIGASRTTVRRYLEYLVSQMNLDVDISYGGVGRPERRYFRKKH